MQQALIIGSPNSGKSLLFNRLTGLSHKVANFPGVTLNVSSGQSATNPNLKIADYPGAYSLRPVSEEERVATRAFKAALLDEELKLVVCILDATRVEKGLYFCLQVIRESQKHNKPVIIVANMVDILEKHSMSIDDKGLADALGVPVFPISAKTGFGFDALSELLRDIPEHDTPALDSSVPANTLIDASDPALRSLATELANKHAPKGDLLIRTQATLDSFFLHSWFGGISFFVIMYLLFQSIFTWATPLMDTVETLLSWLASFILPLIGNQTANDFTKDALFGGLGAFLVFVPQIFVLTLVVGLLEDSGYLSRAAVICHKPLRAFGLTGKSFVPMLSGVACAIPGIYAARTIDSPRKRWLTYFAIPLMPCSARLPVYTLLIAAFIPANKILGGLVGLQGLAMFGIYLFGIFCGLLVTWALSKSRPARNTDLPFVLEMPPYRLPSWQPLLRNSWNRSKKFLSDAGPIIFVVSVVIWILGYYPGNGADLAGSWLGQIGQFIEPIFEPLGLDWKYGVAILTSFLAREVFVGTLGTLFGMEGAEENLMPLVEQIQLSELTMASGFALLVFFAIAMQCVSTLAVLGKESGSRKLPIQMFTAYSIFAYISAWLTYSLISAVIS